MVDIQPLLVHDPILNAQLRASHLRAAMGEELKLQFGEEVFDELLDLYRNKCEEYAPALDPRKPVNYVVVLRRKADWFGDAVLVLPIYE